MIMPDVNVLVYAHRPDSAEHQRVRQWLESILKDSTPYAVTDLALSGFLRVVTHPRIFANPTPLPLALDFVRQIRDQTRCRVIAPGARRWQIFSELCKSQAAAGSLISDYRHAAVAIEFGCEWITTDRDYRKIPGLRWRHPLTGEKSQ